MPERRLQAVEAAGELLPVSVELFTVKSLAYEGLRQRIRTCRPQYPTSPSMARPTAGSAFVADRVGQHLTTSCAAPLPWPAAARCKASRPQPDSPMLQAANRIRRRRASSP